MTLTVAIASEHDSFDGEVYRYLLERMLAVPVTRWTGTFRFDGCKSVAKLAPAFLEAAHGAGVRHALFAVDNDGGATRRPEHDVAHAPAPFDVRDDDSCRECWLEASLGPLPASFTAGGGRTCVVVPVQVVETWLLVLRKEPMAPTPERAHAYHRPTLKRRFFGKPTPPFAERLAMALTELQKPDALDVLAQRPSFQRFTGRLAAWRT